MEHLLFTRERVLSFTWKLGRDAFQKQTIDLIWGYWKNTSF